MRNAVLAYPYYLSLYDAQKIPYISTELLEKAYIIFAKAVKYNSYHGNYLQFFLLFFSKNSYNSFEDTTSSSSKQGAYLTLPPSAIMFTGVRISVRPNSQSMETLLADRLIFSKS
jgi:hypothetical protein